MAGQGWAGQGRAEERENGDTVETESRRAVVIFCPVHQSVHQPPGLNLIRMCRQIS